MHLSRGLLILLGLAAAAPTVATADDAASREIIEKAIAKSGGDKLAKANAVTIKLKGTVQVNGAPVPLSGEIATDRGERQRIAITVQVDGDTIPFASIVNKDQGWIKIGDNVVDMPDQKLKDARDAANVSWVTLLVPVRDKMFKLAPIGEVDVAGRKANGVAVSRDGHRSVNLFFDKETSHLVQTETVVRDEVSFQEVTETITHSDFKVVDGITHASKVLIKRDGQVYAELEVEEYKPAEKLDDSQFTRP